MALSQEVTIYRETMVSTASPVELVIMLCGKLLADMKHVAEAIRTGDIQERVDQSNHAFMILQELDLMLDFDNGGETAKELARVYSHVRAKLIEAQIKLDPAIVGRQIQLIEEIRHAWQKAVRAIAQPMNVEDTSSFVPPVTPYGNFVEQGRSCSWSA